MSKSSNDWTQAFYVYTPEDVRGSNGVPRRHVACDACRRNHRRVRSGFPFSYSLADSALTFFSVFDLSRSRFKAMDTFHATTAALAVFIALTAQYEFILFSYTN